jgi:hypothetical protein
MSPGTCPECGKTIDDPEGLCTNPECPANRTPDGRMKIPTHGWPGAIALMVVLALIAATVLVIIPFKVKPQQKTEDKKDIESKIERIEKGQSEKEIILAQGATEAPKEEKPEPPGGLDWDRLRYPGSERLLNNYGKELKDDEQAYLTSDPYDKVKQYYIDLITDAFYKKPQMAEYTDHNKKVLTLQNQTGSLLVWITAPNYDTKVHILVTKTENLSNENLKPFGGPKKDDGENHSETGK